MGLFSGVLELLISKTFWPLRPKRDTKLSLNSQRGPFNVKMFPPSLQYLRELELPKNWPGDEVLNF